ncbi:MAG: DUF6452 family protein [Prevotellaceae bacterium]|nr:DUF6452 family protein [Prevotellaceae bacterium]
MRLLMTAMAVALVLGACTSIDCPVENNVATQYRLLKSDGTQDTLRDTITVMIRKAKGNDTILLNKSVDTQSFQLPISYTNDIDTFTIIRTGTDYEVKDTLLLEKTNLPQFESVDCKLVYFHDVLSMKHTCHGIDSILINKVRIDYDTNAEHFYIFFKADI